MQKYVAPGKALLLTGWLDPLSPPEYHLSTGVLAFLHDTVCLIAGQIVTGGDGFLSAD